MRIAQVGKSLLSGAVLYLVMAACSASDKTANNSAVNDGGVVDIVDAFVDAFASEAASPVEDANAGPLPPDVATEQCTKSGTLNGYSYLFAVHAYPGKTVQDLSAVRVVTHIPSQYRSTIDGTAYDYGASVPLIRDGYVAVNCGTSGNQGADSVMFILPQ